MKKNAFTFILLLCLSSFCGQAAPIKQKYYLVQEEEGPEAPPGVFIDSFVGALLLAGIVLAYFTLSGPKNSANAFVPQEEGLQHKEKESPFNHLKNIS